MFYSIELTGKYTDMKFEKFINALDMGYCHDQKQREAIFDLVLYVMAADGMITEDESNFMHQWLQTIEWHAQIDKEEYYTVTLLKCYAAIKNNSVDDFLSHRAKLLIDTDVKQQAMDLVRKVAMVDGDLDKSEQQAIDLLSDLLEKSAN